MIQIQASFVGFSGAPCSLFSAYDQAARVLVVSAEAAYREERRDGCIVLANVPEVASDFLFGMRDLKSAIEAFYALKGGVSSDGKSSRLIFSERAVRANPEMGIERDGIDESGPKYRIADSLTCGQAAALATCLHAIRSDGIERAVSMAEKFRRLSYGDILTI